MKHHMRKLLKWFPSLKCSAQRMLRAQGVSTYYHDLADAGRAAQLERSGQTWKSDVLLATLGLELLVTNNLNETLLEGQGHSIRSYVCRKKGA